MRKIFLLTVIFCLYLALGITANSQGDALNLPTELYVLLNEGVLERYGLGTSGVQKVTPEDQFVVDFGISPDGNWLAYRTETALIMAEILTGSGSVLEFDAGIPPIRGAGQTIAWSPDASAIAYTTEFGMRIYIRPDAIGNEPTFVNVTDSVESLGFSQLKWSPDGRFIAATNLTNIWQVYRVDGSSISLVAAVPASTDLVWLNSEEIIFSPFEGGMSKIDLAEANMQTVILPDDAVYKTLVVRQNGEIAAFKRPQSETNFEESFGVYTRINPLTGEEETTGEVALEQSGLAWTPEGEFTVAFRGGAIALVNPSDGTGFTLPISGGVAYGWGATPLPTTEGFVLSQNLFFIADSPTGIAQVWQLFPDGTPPLPLTRAEGSVRGYAISPDGFSIVYSSDSALWLQRLNSSTNPIQLAPLSADINAMPSFNPIDQTIAYVDNGIWIVNINGGEPTLLANNSLSDEAVLDNRAFYNPRFAPNRNALLVDILYYEGASTGVLDTTSGELLELPFGLLNGEWLYDGRIMTFAAEGPFTQSGIQVTSVEDFTNPEIMLPPEISVGDAVMIANRQSESIRLVTSPGINAGPTPLQIYDYRPVAGMLPVMRKGFIQYPQLSADGGFIAGYNRSQLDENGYPIGQLVLLNIETGEQTALSEPNRVTQIQWQR